MVLISVAWMSLEMVSLRLLLPALSRRGFVAMGVADTSQTHTHTYESYILKNKKLCEKKNA